MLTQKQKDRRRFLRDLAKRKTARQRDPLDYGKNWPCPFWPLHIRGARAGLPRDRVDAARWKAAGYLPL